MFTKVKQHAMKVSLIIDLGFFYGSKPPPFIVDYLPWGKLKKILKRGRKFRAEAGLLKRGTGIFPM